MNSNLINRKNDDEIINIVRSVLDNGTGRAETPNEHVLIKLMQIRNTPIKNFEFEQEQVDFHFDQWSKEKVEKDMKNTCDVCGGGPAKYTNRENSLCSIHKNFRTTDNSCNHPPSKQVRGKLNNWCKACGFFPIERQIKDKFIPYQVDVSNGKTIIFTGKYRRDLETNNWHYYEKKDGIIIHFRKEHIIYVEGDTDKSIKNSQNKSTTME